MSPLPAPISCDSLYVSPHADDVALSCPARLLADAARGRRVAVVTLFGEASGAAGPWASQSSLGLPEASRRSPGYPTFRDLAEARHADDEPWLLRVVEALFDLAHQTGASQVYIPLGVGSHIDHRLAHEAALRSFQSGDGRDVFLYEERPEAFARGAVRARLGEVGARLPPAAAQAAEMSGLLPFLLRFHRAPTLRGDMHGFSERLRATGLAARQWRAGRAWHPQRGFGPRVQPVVHVADAEAAGEAVRLATLTGSRAAAAPERLARQAAAYARRLGAKGYAERYWLLLPARDEGQISA
jgi:LmbE family N-acetylglucosaminyl deacetylase